MMKWLWALIAMFAFAAAWQAPTPGMLGLWLLLGIVAIVASFLGFLSARVGAVAGAQMHRETALLATIEGRAKRTPPGRNEAGAAVFTGSVAYGATHDDGHPRHEGIDGGASGDFGSGDSGGSDGGGGDGGGGGGD
jgi:uncharacterized membrane protein YgcG